MMNLISVRRTNRVRHQSGKYIQTGGGSEFCRTLSVPRLKPGPGGESVPVSAESLVVG